MIDLLFESPVLRLLLFVVVIVGGILLMAVIAQAMADLASGSQKISRPGGFEVKLNTGEEPVIKKERETDHG